MGSAEVIRFPPRRSPSIWVMRDAESWLVVARDHGWRHGSRADAAADAAFLSGNLQMPVRWERA